MELGNLQNHIRTPAALEETASPVISYYSNQEPEMDKTRLILAEQRRGLRQSLTGQASGGHL